MTNSRNPRKLVVIGNGMAAGRVLDETLARDAGRFRIIVFGAEPRFDYNRILLSSVLSGEARRDEIVIHDEAWYRRNKVTLHKGECVVAIDRAAKTVTTATGRSESYDELLIATGSTPILLPIPGADLAGVVTFRDLDDVDAMLRRAERGGRVVVIGGGLLGLEAAAGLRTRGLEVTVLHLMPTLMERQLDAAAGDLLRKAIEARGIRGDDGSADAGDPRRGDGRRRAARRRARDRLRHGGDGDRHSAECAARQSGGPRRRARRRGR